jgi:DNA (cytosine-5)-methyltransferase 1
VRRLLDLFSGIGGFSLAARWTGKIKTVAFCEIDPFCQRVLTKHWPDVPIFTDIRALKGVDVGPVDIITGGFPCQPFSQAGKQRGTEDDRHLWPEMSRVIKELRPTWVLGENVGGLAKLGLDQVLSDMESVGYSTRTFDIPACAVDARHVRHRLWIVGFNPHSYANSGGCVYGTTAEYTTERGKYAFCELERFRSIMANSDRRRCGQSDEKQRGFPEFDERSTDVADSKGIRMEGDRPSWEQESGLQVGEGIPRCDCPGSRGGFWISEPNVGRVAHGVPNRVDRLKSLGNAIVPQVAYQILIRMVE